MNASHEELRRTQSELQQTQWKLKELLGQYFAKSSEKIDPNQLQLLLEGIEAAEGALEPSAPQPAAPVAETKRYRNKRTRFPQNLREEIIEIDLPEAERICPVTGLERKFIRWEETTKVDLIPSSESLSAAANPPGRARRHRSSGRAEDGPLPSNR